MMLLRGFAAASTITDQATVLRRCKTVFKNFKGLRPFKVNQKHTAKQWQVIRNRKTV
jgi:hypothetical protein